MEVQILVDGSIDEGIDLVILVFMCVRSCDSGKRKKQNSSTNKNKLHLTCDLRTLIFCPDCFWKQNIERSALKKSLLQLIPSGIFVSGRLIHCFEFKQVYILI